MRPRALLICSGHRLPLTKSFSRDSNRNETYTYDAADRVASLTRGIAGSQSWNLDKLGNWNSVTTDSVTQNRDHSPLTPGPQNGLNEIVDLKDASNTVTDNLSYDDAGNLTAITPVSGTARNFTWDANSRLKNWAKGATSIDYQYDAYGRRVSDGERRYVYGAGWRVAEERDLSNPQTDITDGSLVAMPLLKTLVYGNYLDEVVQYDTKVNPSYNTAPTSNWDGRGDSGYDNTVTDVKTGEHAYSRTYNIHCDQIYSAKALTNSAGDLAEYYDYTAYGAPTIYKGAGTDGNWFTTDDIVFTDGLGNPNSAFKNDHLYTGQRWERLTLQHYYKNRYFESTLGRFLSHDPIGVKEGMNLYDFCANSPVDYIDPNGKETLSHKAIGGDLSWTLYQREPNYVHAIISFMPSGKCCCKTIGFIQVVLERSTGGKPTHLKPDKYEDAMARLRTKDNAFIDVLPGQGEAYYNTKWDPSSKKWVEKGEMDYPGSCLPTKEAEMTDNPNFPDARQGNGAVILRFETCAFCIETGEVLGCIKWGFSIQDSSTSTIQQLNGGQSDYEDQPSEVFRTAIAKWNSQEAAFQWRHGILVGQPTTSSGAMGGSSALPSNYSPPKYEPPVPPHLQSHPGFSPGTIRCY